MLRGLRVSDKTVKTLIILAVLAGGGYLAWRWYANYRAGQAGGGVPQLGTNLNSVAPELVGGSSGPAVAPAANIPVSITITDSRSTQMPETPNTPMLPVNQPTNNQLNAANDDSGSDMPEDAATVTPLVKQGPKVTAPIRREPERRRSRERMKRERRG